MGNEMYAIQREVNNNDWKIKLREELITILTGEVQERVNTYWKIGNHYTCLAPASLFKYYSDSITRLESIRANKMWYSAPCKFNDVFDCDISVDETALINCVLQLTSENTSIRAGSTAWKHILRNISENVKLLLSSFEAMKSTMGVSCLSESDESLLMWAHYANNHRGMCVEYDMMEIIHQLHFTPVPVIYSDERVCLRTLNPDTAGSDAVALFFRSITSKSKEWSYEREWRIIREEEACGNKWDKEKKGALLDMIRPTSITLGCAAEEEFEKSVREYCEGNRIPMYKMQKDKGQYQLHKVKVLAFES